MGLRPVGRIDPDGKGVLTEEVGEAYPAAISKAEWDEVNAAIDGRQRGTGAGRNRSGYANLFGPLAVCAVCGGRMAIRGKGSYSTRRYFGCTNSGDGQTACGNKRYFRVDQVERHLFKMIPAIPWNDEPAEDKTESLAAQLDAAKREVIDLQRNIDAMAASFADAPPAIRASMNKLAATHATRQATVVTLARQLATLRSAKPADAQGLAAETLSKRLERLSGAALIETRGKVAALLATLLTRLSFAPDAVTLTAMNGGTYRLGEWHAIVGALYQPQPAEVERGCRRWDEALWRDPDRVRAGLRAKEGLRMFDAAQQRKRRAD